MKRVVIIGRGASGKSTLAARLGEITGLPVIELDKVFWRPGLVATSRDQWVVVQEGLVAEEGWIIDGDLGPYDVVEVRLRAADTILFLEPFQSAISLEGEHVNWLVTLVNVCLPLLRSKTLRVFSVEQTTKFVVGSVAQVVTTVDPPGWPMDRTLPTGQAHLMVNLGSDVVR